MPCAEEPNGDFYFFSSVIYQYLYSSTIIFILLTRIYATNRPYQILSVIPTGFHITSVCLTISVQMVPVHPVISMNLLPCNLQF